MSGKSKAISKESKQENQNPKSKSSIKKTTSHQVKPSKSLEIAFEQSAKKKMLKFRLFKTVKATTCITDLYEIGNTLGKGSFGEVKVCTHKLTGLQHAMKIVSKVEISKHPMVVRLMENELKVLQNTEHPHIIRVVELL